MTFAAIDWVMSLSPHWASTIYGFLFVAGQLISSMSLMISVVVLLAQAEPFKSVIQKRHLHDLGKLLLAFVMLWAYFSFLATADHLVGQPAGRDQLLSLAACTAQWGVVAVIILIFHFFVPFFLLLSRDLKRNPSALPKVAIWLILMRLVDLFWMTRPEFTASAMPSVWDLAAPLALGGLWFGRFRVAVEADAASSAGRSETRGGYRAPMSTDRASRQPSTPGAEPVNADVSFEKADVSPSAIYIYLIGLAVAVILSYVVCVFVLRGTTNIADESDTPPPPIRQEMGKSLRGDAAGAAAPGRSRARQRSASGFARKDGAGHGGECTATTGSTRVPESRRFRSKTR